MIFALSRIAKVKDRIIFLTLLIINIDGINIYGISCGVE